MIFQEFGHRALIIFIFIVGLFWGAFLLNKDKSSHLSLPQLKLAAQDVCDLVLERYFEKDKVLDQWYKDCSKYVSELSESQNIESTISGLQALLNIFSVSHLYINTPAEDKAQWQGLRLETGIRAINLGGYLIIFKIIKKSSAEKAGFLPGDLIEEINGRRAMFIREVRDEGGTFVVKRGRKRMRLECDLSEVKIDEQPYVHALNKDIGVLRISSFREEYFAESEVKKIGQQIQNYQHLVVDLRGNLGGNFAAMLRALSFLFCKPTVIGELQRPRQMGKKIVKLPDNLDSEMHFDLLEQISRVALQTYDTYACFKGRVNILIDEETASVSEIFASAAKENARGKVWGKISAGQVLLAVWYELPRFGEGYSLAIPEATYMSNAGVHYEREGVEPDRVLDYIYSEAIAGQDSWLVRLQSKAP